MRSVCRWNPLQPLAFLCLLCACCFASSSSLTITPLDNNSSYSIHNRLLVKVRHHDDFHFLTNRLNSAIASAWSWLFSYFFGGAEESSRTMGARWGVVNLEDGESFDMEIDGGTWTTSPLMECCSRWMLLHVYRGWLCRSIFLSQSSVVGQERERSPSHHHPHSLYYPSRPPRCLMSFLSTPQISWCRLPKIYIPFSFPLLSFFKQNRWFACPYSPIV